MHTPVTENGQRAGLGRAVKEVTERLSSIVRLELQLASLELKHKVSALGMGIGLGVGAVVFGVFMFGFLFATIAAALATFLATWLALLIVTVFLLLVAGILGGLSVRAIKRGTPPVPQQAIQEAKLTTSALKGGNGNH
jgi:uncharacterized membrane protein YqjE